MKSASETTMNAFSMMMVRSVTADGQGGAVKFGEVGEVRIDPESTRLAV